MSRTRASHLQRWLPGYRTAQIYRREWFGPDLLAGLVLTSLLIPHGMAYAQLAGVPPVTGLYTTVLALVAYTLFGPSRRLMLGPDSTLAPLIAAAILPVAAGDPETAIAAASILALFVGAICVVAGLIGLGAITELLSKPVRIGYLNGLAVVMVVSQLPTIAGFAVDEDGVVAELGAFFEEVVDEVDGTALAVGLSALALIVALNIRWPRVPAVLFAVVGATLVSAIFDLGSEGVVVIGALPDGFPTPAIPTVDAGDLGELALAAIAISVVAFADTSALSSSVARSSRASVDPDQEVVALGTANLAAGLFQGFPVSASTTRTALASAVGARTQLTGVVGAALVSVLVLFADELVRDLPVPALAAVIVAAAYRLVDLETLRWMFRVRQSDLLLSLAATAGVVFWGVFEGIAVAVGLSLAVFVWRSWRPHDAVLGRIDGVKGYHDLERHPEAHRIPGLVLFRFDAPLFFANAQYFRRRVDRAVGGDLPTVRWLVLSAEPMTDIDTSGAEVLTDLLDDMDHRGIRVVMAEAKGPVKDRLRRYGLYDRIGDDGFYPTIGTAISGYLRETGVDWTDWTDRSK